MHLGYSTVLRNIHTSFKYRISKKYQKHVPKINQINMAYKLLTVSQFDLNYSTTRRKQNILRVDSEVIGSDDSTTEFIFEPV